MIRRPPRHIAEANVPFTTPDYQWNDQVEEETKFLRQDRADRVLAMSDRAGLALSLGCFEWTVWRLHRMLPDERTFGFLDAAWAGIVDWKYLDAFDGTPWEEP